MKPERHEPPEFLEVSLGEKAGFVPFEEAVSNPRLSSQLVTQALAEIVDWRDRYVAFFQRINEPAALQIIQAIDAARQSLAEEADANESGLMYDPDD